MFRKSKHSSDIPSWAGFGKERVKLPHSTVLFLGFVMLNSVDNTLMFLLLLSSFHRAKAFSASHPPSRERLGLHREGSQLSPADPGRIPLYMASDQHAQLWGKDTGDAPVMPFVLPSHSEV